MATESSSDHFYIGQHIAWLQRRHRCELPLNGKHACLLMASPQE